MCSVYMYVIRQQKFAYNPSFIARGKERGMTQSYDKSPYTNRKNATRNFDYTTIENRLRKGVKTAFQLVIIAVNRFTGTQPSHWP